MSKIVRAVNSMVSQKDKISNVLKKGEEYFFLFEDKYKWSVLNNKSKASYMVYYYSGDQSLQDLATMDDIYWENFEEYIVYSSEDIKTVEANETFSELYMLVKEMAFGINKVLDDIIGEEF